MERQIRSRYFTFASGENSVARLQSAPFDFPRKSFRSPAGSAEASDTHLAITVEYDSTQNSHAV